MSLKISTFLSNITIGIPIQGNIMNPIFHDGNSVKKILIMKHAM